MKTFHCLFFLIFGLPLFGLQSSFAQNVAPILLTTMNSKNHRHCCCDCSCDTVRVHYKPIHHWNDVKHIVYVGMNPASSMNVSLLNADIEQNRALTSLMSNVPSLYFGHEHIYRDFFFGGEIGGTFGSKSIAITPELNMRAAGTLNLNLNLGYHLITTQQLRLYVLGSLQFAHANLRLQRHLADIPQKSWNRFINSQNQLLPYDRLVEGFLTTDRWGDEITMSSSFFATQLRIGMDYRIGNVKFGLHTGYSFQLSDKARNWKYTYEFEEGDEHKTFDITNVPATVSLGGLNVGFSVGYLISSVVK